MLSRFAPFALIVSLSWPLAAADVWQPPDGFIAAELDAAAASAFVGGLALAPNGDPVLFDGEAVVRLEEGGRTVLWRPASPVFGSFLEMDPGGGAVYFGESSEHTIRRIPLDGGDARRVETIPFDFDMAFDARGRAFVSAPFDDATNGVWWVDLDPATPPVLVAKIPGASGPLAFLPGGDLLVATAGWGVPVDLLAFGGDAVEGALGGTPLEASAARVLVAGLDGAYGLAIDPAGRIFATDSMTGAVLLVEPDGAVTTFAAPREGVFAAPTYIALRPGEGPFVAGAGPAGGRMAFTSSDFATFNLLTLITPQTYFVRGEVNGDGKVDIADAVWTLGYLFGGLAVRVADAADINDDGALDIGDPVYLLGYLFQGGSPPPAPFPAPGADPTPDELPAP